ncbi:two-component system, OmpR family, sensor histidine kinase ResE [Candidatus Frackibacter sp. WG11]|uniref:sensor histidine kinase n=1 Tax=Candidatus Frackibacter sp. WG11 TaxID=2017976 RepID=UPI0008851A81|nr:ATP-binding protein [Candidatus Frackibacter sp. WG11]SDC26753.1 two-component system, OmpR family, sensor histidine kinase ResE [Candidatus Frackibacter sp. WG11]
MQIFKGIFGKLMARFVTVILITLIVLGIFLTYTFENYYFKSKEEEFIKQGEEVANLVETSLCNGNYQQTVQYLRRASQFLEGKVCITDSKGLILAASNRNQNWRGVKLEKEEVKKVLNGQIVTRKGMSPLFEQPVLSVAVPVTMDNKVIGAVFVYAPLAGISGIMGKLQELLFFATLMAIVLAILLSFTFSKSLLNPLNRVNQAALRLAKGEFNTRVKTKTNDEIAQLGQTFNYLAGELEATIAELNQEKNKIESILVSMNEGVVAINEDREIILTNPQAETLLNLSQDRLGEKLSQITDNQDLLNIFNSALEEEEVAINEFTLENFQQPIRILVHVAPIFANEELLGVVGVMQDISDRWELEQLQKEFVANVSHELKTPLTSIQGFVKAIRDKVVTDEELEQEYLNIILDEVKRLTRLVNDLLDLSQIESGQIAMNIAEYNLKDIIEQTVLNLQPQIDKKNLTINIESSDDAEFNIFLDRDRIGQVLLNLLNNAISFTPESGEIKVQIKDLGEEVKVSIEDSGPGIPEDELKYIWNRFHKVDKARTRTGNGTGLGLSIVKEIIEQHQGQIGVESKLGEGAKFNFILPKNLQES